MKNKPAKTQKTAVIKPTLKSLQINLTESLKRIEDLREELTRVEALNKEMDVLFQQVAGNTLELDELSDNQNWNTKLAIAAIVLSVIAIITVVIF